MEKDQISHKGLSSNQLKIIAIIAMVIDHCTTVFISSESEWALLLRAIGRLTAPIMCFFIAEGYYHTSNLKKYMGRLLLIAIISHIPHNLCLGQNVWQFWNATDVMFPLLFGLIALVVYKSERLYKYYSYIIREHRKCFAYEAHIVCLRRLWVFIEDFTVLLQAQTNAEPDRGSSERRTAHAQLLSGANGKPLTANMGKRESRRPSLQEGMPLPQRWFP